MLAIPFVSVPVDSLRIRDRIDPRRRDHRSVPSRFDAFRPVPLNNRIVLSILCEVLLFL